MTRFARTAFLVGVLSLPLSACEDGPSPFRPAVFDLAAVRRQADLAVSEVPGSTRVVDGMSLREVRFTSTAWDRRGVPRPIRVQAFVATPPGATAPHSKPAVVFAHGFGGQADPETAFALCRNLDVVALSVSAPGVGGSEGEAATPADPGALFAGTEDIRGSWLYGYVHAILRSITYASTLREVDAQAIALTGFSMGGIATFIANGVDDRIRGALPVSASGGLAQAAAAKTWLRDLILGADGRKPDGPGAEALFRALDPLAYAGRQRGVVYMLTGAQDEFFPLAQALDTFHAIRAPHKSLAIVADYDHGWYFGGGCPARCMPGMGGSGCPPAPACPAVCPPGASPPYCGPAASYNREADFSGRWALLLRALLARHVARPPRPFAPAPAPPTIERSADAVVVRSEGTPRAVRLAISENCGWTYQQVPLTRGSDGAYRHAQRTGQGAIIFAEVEGPDGAVATSAPRWPQRCKPPVRPYGPRP